MSIYSGFSKAIRRLLKNKLLMLNCLSSVFGHLGWGTSTYMGRMMEVQFNKTSAGGSVFTGPLNMLAMAIGILLSGVIITKYRPPAKYLLAWNVIITVTLACGSLSYTQLGSKCDNSPSLIANGSIVTCNANCVCDEISYSPVCDHSTSSTNFSACHAGCKSLNTKHKTSTVIVHVPKSHHINNRSNTIFNPVHVLVIVVLIIMH